MQKIAISTLLLLPLVLTANADQTLPRRFEALHQSIIGTLWEWDGSSGETIEFQEDGYIGHPGWRSRGLVTSWHIIDLDTVLLKVEKGRSYDLYAILTFSKDYSSFSGYNFHGGAELRVSNPLALWPIVHDLEVELTIDELEKQIAVGQSTPDVEIHSVKVHRDLTKTRCCLAIKFTSRNIDGVLLDLLLLDDSGVILGEVRHFEKVGPELVIIPGHNLDLRREWDSWRAIWLDYPADAINAEKFKLVVTSIQKE